MSKEVECLDAMIFEGEARIAELEDELLACSGDMDIERTMHILQLMYRNLNRLYAERISLTSGASLAPL